MASYFRTCAYYLGVKLFQSRAFRFFNKLIAAFLSLFLKPREKRETWAIACGGARWGDNAKALYDHLESNYSNLLPVAVLKPGYDGVRPNNFVTRGSLKNLMLLERADVLCTTHTHYDLGPRPFVWAATGAKVWLKHGVTGIKFHPPEGHKWNDYDLVCSTSDFEADLLSNSRAIDRKKIAVTGFSRHDVLFKEYANPLKDGILFMPTFRPVSDSKQAAELIEKVFGWTGAFHRKKFDDMPLKIWLHPSWAKNVARTLEEKFCLIDADDVQSALISSKILITDYSSLAFEAAISETPVIFFQPDRASYVENRGLYSEFLNNDHLLTAVSEKQLFSILSELSSNLDFYTYRQRIDKKWGKQYISTFDGKSSERIKKFVDALIA